MYYGYNLGCRFGMPHKTVMIKDAKNAIYEKCEICSKRFKWTKGYKGRINNKEYLKVHLRDFAQSFGSTKRVYNKLYCPEKCIIKI